MRKVLIANRGEIAARVARACRDAGLLSVAVYADQDRDAPHVRLADEAFALHGATAAQTYLDVHKLLAVAARADADAVHPGYGFLSENAGFAQAVLDAGLIWIGPPPAAISTLGDKVAARELAARVGAPLVPGTAEPVPDAAAALAFATEHGFPVAIKAAFGGGGRGLKVARTSEELPALYDSAVREAVAAFGRGEVFLERFLDGPRHVETQCLADTHGAVVVVSTRDCSLQRRHQKVVEEAPAPFLDAGQVAELYRSSKALLREAGYVGAGTCEFLLGRDGTLSFLEVNTRLQVEHPVSEEVTGLDLVREQLRIAAGEELGYDDPPVRGHALEFRINGEDPGRGWLPTPGTVRTWRLPQGPGVRVDAGVDAGTTVSGAFDSLLAKLIVTGASRTEALARARRALTEFEVDGIPTTLPFARAVVDDAAFTSEPFTVSTCWIEDGWGGVPPQDTPQAPATVDDRESVVVEVDGRRLEVTLPRGTMAGSGSATSAGPVAPAARSGRRTGGPGHAAGRDALTSPMQGTIVTVAVTEGQPVRKGDLLVVLEAMKMEQPLTAHKDGVVTALTAQVGATVSSGSVLCEIRDAAEGDAA
jgi:acetyl-CoA/propionyl-CoA carboxylase biotin carboxyl carrier protein